MVEFSIVYTTYRPGGIDILADSLANQTFKDYELIIIDDFKIDRREEVSRYLSERGIPLSFIGPSKPKCFSRISFNVSNAINTGFILSKKDVVIVLQDYQWLPPDCLQKLAAHEDLYKQKYCVVLPGHAWDSKKRRNNEGIISIWPREWEGRPSNNRCVKSFEWIPEGWEFACTAYPWEVIQSMNGYPEYLDAAAAHPLKPLIEKFEYVGARPFVDTDNFMHIINHREWQPAELWHQAKRKPTGSIWIIERTNCFDLKDHTRGEAYWLSSEIFERPDYWCGEVGYRPGPDGKGYQDFSINQVKADYVLSKTPQGKVLDIGAAMGYCIRRLRQASVDAYGVDVSSYAIQSAPEDVKPYLQQASANSLPFTDKEFDMAISFSVFEHLPEDIVHVAIREAVRVARRGIISVTPSEDSHFDEDKTHKTKRPLKWWREQFPPEFEVISDADEDWLSKASASKTSVQEIRYSTGGPQTVVLSHYSSDRTEQMIKLNLGSFVDTIGHGWTNIDILALQSSIKDGHKFKQWDLRQGIPCDDNSVDLVRSSHLLEHFHLEDTHNLCNEIYRVLKPEGLARIAVPSIELIIKHYRNRDMSYFNAIQPTEYIKAPTEAEKLSRILFSGDYSHRACFNFEMLQDFLKTAGFTKIYQVSPGFSYKEIMKSETEDQHIEVSLIVEAIK